MKRYSHLRLLILALGVVFVWPTQAWAAGGTSSLLKLTSSASSATVGSKITIYLYAYQYACNEGPTISINTKPFTCSDGTNSYERPKANDEFWVTITGSNNTFTGLTTSDGNYVVQTGANGKGQFTISSTKAETKTITAKNNYGYNSELNKSINVTFKTAAAPVVPAPEAPKASLEILGHAPSEGAITLRNKQPLVLKGTTVANASVKLYIFSDPKQETVTADANGNWAYTVSGLEPGDHHVEAEVTDPTTGKTSARATLATFSVAQPAQAMSTSNVVAPSTIDLWILPAIVSAIAIVAGGVWWWITKRKKVTNPIAPKEHDSTANTAVKQTRDGGN